MSNPEPGVDVDPADVADLEAHIARLVRGRIEPDRTDLARFLRANPGCTVRDWKGKGPSVPPDAEAWEEPWHRLKPSDVREAAVSAFARELPRGVRQAAARDESLVWNPLARKYRRRADASPAPPLAHSGNAKGEGGMKSSSTSMLQTGDGHEFEINDVNRRGFSHD